MSPFLAPAEEIVANLIFEWLDETRINRTIKEYIAIARRAPKIDAAHADLSRNVSAKRVFATHSWGLDLANKPPSGKAIFGRESNAANGSISAHSCSLF